MGLEPVTWGPHVWAAIHIICLGAPEVFQGNDHLSYFKFFDSLPYVLPCEKCREHLKQHMEKNPIDAALSGGRSTLFSWSVKLHNAVNRSLNKPEMSVEDARRHWNSVLYGAKTNQKDAHVMSRTSCGRYAMLRKIILVFMLIITGIIIGIVVSSFITKN